MKILLSGSTGLIGSALMTFLQAAHYEVIPLTRNQALNKGVYWDPANAYFRLADFEHFDAVIHLAGENIAAKRWSRSRKQTLINSRCRDSTLLSHILSLVNFPPKTVISASAVGFYGSRWNEILTEKSSKGNGFLADLSANWEKAIHPLEHRGIRVVYARFGVVLTPTGGAPTGGMLKKMIALFQWGLGGKMGSGKQVMSWIALEDAVGAIFHILKTPILSGPVNIVAPYPITQEAFTKILGLKLHRPTIFSLPKWLLRIVFGQMADELLLASAYVVPEKLLSSGYVHHLSRFEL